MCAYESPKGKKAHRREQRKCVDQEDTNEPFMTTASKYDEKVSLWIIGVSMSMFKTSLFRAFISSSGSSSWTPKPKTPESRNRRIRQIRDTIENSTVLTVFGFNDLL